MSYANRLKSAMSQNQSGTNSDALVISKRFKLACANIAVNYSKAEAQLSDRDKILLRQAHSLLENANDDIAIARICEWENTFNKVLENTINRAMQTKEK